MGQKVIIITGIFLCLLQGCTPSYKALLQELQNLPNPDYSYAVNPVFKSSKDDLEFKIMGLYQAEEARFDIAKYHTYDDDTYEQINERFWVHFMLYNSEMIDINDQGELFDEGRKIARIVMESLSNADQYDKIQVTFLKQWREGDNIRQTKHPEFYLYPSFEETEF